MKPDEKRFMTHYELQNIRKDLGISQAQFAKDLGVAKTTYCWWEQNRNPINEWAANLINLTTEQIKAKKAK